MVDFEERADQLSLETIDASLSDGQIFRRARHKLLAPGAKLLVGPRGTGKTHIMRYTYVHAMRNESSPIALYANFSRYLNLEPLLLNSPDALKRFHSWVIAKLLLSAFDFISDKGDDKTFFVNRSQYFDEDRLRELVALLERSGGGSAYEEFGQNLTVNLVIDACSVLCERYKRKRTVLLLDDAALSLAGAYLIAFFDIYRLLKTGIIAPKASVYPGSTQYGPTFHASHEVEMVPLWLAVDDPEYSMIMGDIAERRLTAEEIGSINDDTLDTLKYVAFGSPRAYLRVLREYLDTNGTSQQKINAIVERHAELIGAEYDSLGLKLRQFSSLIATGRKFFDATVEQVASSQDPLGRTKSVVFGLRQGEDRTPLAERMLKFLIEVGMLYPLQAVSHGPNRKYDRYIPHLAFLYEQGAFRTGRGSSSKDLPSYMRRPSSKHPVRRDLSSLLSGEEIKSLKLDLPPCAVCGVPRINEAQKFCHNCGAELVASSLFEDCMKLPLENVPGISGAMIARIHRDTKIRTVGHVYASQNPSTDLQQASYVGPVRASGIVGKVTLTVNEFLS